MKISIIFARKKNKKKKEFMNSTMAMRSPDNIGEIRRFVSYGMRCHKSDVLRDTYIRRSCKDARLLLRVTGA